MKKIYLVRHGETQWNKEEIFRGQADIPLNEAGIRQARIAGQALGKIKFAKVFTSPLQRALQTAQIIAPHQKIIQVEGFKDMHFGIWQGMALKKVREVYPEMHRQWKSVPHQVNFPQGENLLQVRRRAVVALRRILLQEPEGTYLIVAHRVINKVLLCYILDLPTCTGFWKLIQDTCAVNVFTWDKAQGFEIISINEHFSVNGKYEYFSSTLDF
jgi:broad specificity phosphatase PhoE